MKPISSEIPSAAAAQASLKKQKSVSAQENTTPPFSSVLKQATAQQRGAVPEVQKETRASQVVSLNNSYGMESGEESTGIPALDKALDMISQFLNQPGLKSGEYFFLSAAAFVRVQKMREQGISMDNVDMSSFFLEIAKEAEAYVENATGTRPNLEQRAQAWLKGDVSVAATGPYARKQA